MSIQACIAAQRSHFSSGATLPVSMRKKALSALLNALTEEEGALLSALSTDLGKHPYEGYMTEVGLVREEIRFQLKHLDKWSRGKTVPTPLSNFPAKSVIRPEPYGVVLIMAPWNYPIQLSLSPLVGALAAGNCAIIKPSAYAPASSHAIGALIAKALPPELVTVIEGGREENQALMDQKFDYIFFTGGVGVGKLVMEKAARHLTPVTLELGGKSPCIVTKEANLKLAARRIAFGKLLNAGQTCVAPDYLLVERSVRKELIALLKTEFNSFMGNYPLENPEFPTIVNEKHLSRLSSILEGSLVLLGGEIEGKRISPTLVDGDKVPCAAMEEEIFGPILPILSFDRLDEVISFVSARPKPLALYLFTTSKVEEELLLSRLSFGGGCVNDTIVHLSTSHLPFGGVGGSGMGNYHGKASFDTFTHYKSILKKANFLDIPVRYHPYSPKKERLLRLFLK